MKNTKDTIGEHPDAIKLADYLDNLLSGKEMRDIEKHVASCNECRARMISSYESVKQFKESTRSDKRKAKNMGRIDLYLILAIISFALSFILPRHFLQLLVATLLLGAKWVADSKSTKMLVMIHEAWKTDGEHGASEVIKRFDRVGHKV